MTIREIREESDQQLVDKWERLGFKNLTPQQARKATKELRSVIQFLLHRNTDKDEQMESEITQMHKKP